MKAYSNDLRRKIVAAYERGQRSQREVAELFGVSPATVRNFVRRKRERGSPDELPRAGGAPARIDAQVRAELRQLIASSPDATLAEAREHLLRSSGVRVGLSAVCRAFSKMGLPRKKSRSTQLSAILPASLRRVTSTERRPRDSTLRVSSSLTNLASIWH